MTQLIKLKIETIFCGVRLLLFKERLKRRKSKLNKRSKIKILLWLICISSTQLERSWSQRVKLITKGD